MKKNVYFTTLGCSKNEVDTDSMKTILENKDYNIVFRPEDSHIMVVNTCGFIESAKEESIGEILAMASYKDQSDRKLLVSGCLAQRYADELIEEIPEIDGLIGTGQIRDIGHFIELLEAGQAFKETGGLNPTYVEGLRKSQVGHVEYVKISEGCNNHCSYCIIPSLRGPNKSRKIEDIVSEVEYLVSQGAKEIVLIGQNTTDYGIDLYQDFKLARLLEELGKIPNLKWIRTLYLYPDHFSQDLIDQFKTNTKLVPYVDIPLQHVSDRVLARMNRKTDKKTIQGLINRLRSEIANIVIRTTMIVGFPGETEEDFQELLEFVKTYQLDKLGVFTYSKEENTPAYKLDGHLDQEVKDQRRDIIMEAQAQISERRLQAFRGRTLDMIVDEIGPSACVGRTYADTIDIDGVCYIEEDLRDKVSVGDIVQVKIVDTMAYDMIGEIQWT